MAASASWVKHPGHYIKEEMETRGWIQRDLAFVLGVPEQSLTAIMSGRRGISSDMAKALGAAFDVPAEFFANLQQAYDLAHASDPEIGVAVRAQLQARFPVREMIKRKWIEPADPKLLEHQLVQFFEVSESDEIPYMPHAAKRSPYVDREIPPAQLAWLFRVRHIARSISVPQYSATRLRSALRELLYLLYAPEEARHVPRILMECGVRLVFVEKLPGAKIDGVCFWLNDASPVIGMSLRHDRIDNFWFVLRHEIEHILREHGRDAEVLDDLDGPMGGTGDSVPEEERVANIAAADFCTPRDKLQSFMARKHPFYYEKDVLAFSKRMNRHPGLIVGQMRKALDRWDYLTRRLVKIRKFVLPGAITDGWGQEFSANF
jgi:HTH-type transcriptional regulator / antitoxin HigA